MNGLPEFLNHPLTIKWGWVLLHFLWQGTILSMLAWVVLSLSAGKAARLRYLLATGCLLLMPACPLVTWISLEKSDRAGDSVARIQDSASPAPSSLSQPVPPIPTNVTQIESEASEDDGIVVFPATSPLEPSVSNPQRSSVPVWTSWLEGCLPWFVAVWSLGVLILSIRLAGGWMFARNCVARGQPLRDPWTGRARQLVDRLKLSRSIRWFESNRIRVPQAMGWLKPVVLVPSSLFTTLSPSEIECLLLHELMHIRRHDFVVNLVQCVIETIFFYHPGVRWLSRRVRLERELACDAAVVSLTDDRFTFSRALLSLADHAQLPQPALAAAEGDLTRRIRAVLGLKRSGSASGFAVWLCLAACAIAVGIVLLVGSQSTNGPEPSADSAVNDQDSSPAIERFVEEGMRVPDLSGKVVDSDGSPVAGATVYLRQTARSRSGRGIPNPWDDLARTSTDAVGSFRFADVYDSEDHRVLPPYDLVALKDGYALGWKHLLPTKPISNIKLTLQSPAAVAGRVTDGEGNPVADAEVRLKHLMSIRHITQADLEEGRWPNWKDRQFVAVDGSRASPVTTTDSEGRFELGGVVADRGLFLEIAHPDYLIRDAFAATVPKLDPETAAKSKREVQTGELSVSLEPGYRVRLRVVDDETGELIPGVRYAHTHKSYTIPPRHHDEDGVIEVNHLTAPKFFAIVHPPENTEYLAYSNFLEWPAETRLKEVEVRLKKGIRVRGRVIGRETGAGVEDAQVYLGRTQQEIDPNTLQLHAPQPVTTDADGYFLMRCPAGEYAFYTRGRIRGFKTASIQKLRTKKITVLADGADSEPVIELEPAPRFLIVVKDPQGKPVAGADVRTRARTSLNSYFPIHGVTDEKGEYLLDQLYMVDAPLQEILPDEVMIRNADNTQAAQLLLERPDEDDPIEQRIEVQLQELGFVEGRTVRAGTGEPIAGTRITLYRRNHDRNQSSPVGEMTITGPDGRFRLKGVFPGIEHHLSLSHTRYRTPNGFELRFTLTDGNVKDFGDIELAQLSPPDVPELAQVTAPDVSGLSAQEAFQVLESKYEAARKTYRDEWDTLKEKFSSKAIAARRDPAPVFCAAYLKLAQRDPQSDIALQACLRIVKSSSSTESVKRMRELRAAATAIIAGNFIDRPEMKDCIWLAVDSFMEKPPHLQTRNADLQLVAAAEELMKANPHRDVHAAATWNVADRLMRMLRGRDFYFRPREPSPQTIELCRKYLTKMEREYPEYEHFIYGTYGKAADRLLYDLETMLVGKTPPDLVAEDVTGKTVKLSDYRGKLVIVDFWSVRMNDHPATDDYSSLKAILEKAGDRVAVLGVVSSSKQDVEKKIEEHQIDYPVFADGEDGPLFKLWNIHAWPTLFLLDENGVILYRGGRGNSLENLLLEKLAERKRASNMD